MRFCDSEHRKVSVVVNVSHIWLAPRTYLKDAEKVAKKVVTKVARKVANRRKVSGFPHVTSEPP